MDVHCVRIECEQSAAAFFVSFTPSHFHTSLYLHFYLSLRFQWGTPQISICAGEEVLRIALRVLLATHRTSEHTRVLTAKTRF